MSDFFLSTFATAFNKRRAGKYSDILMLDTLMNSNTSPHMLACPIPGITYIYRRHNSQDSTSIDLLNYIKMLKYIDGLSLGSTFPLAVADIFKKFILVVCHSLLKESMKYLRKAHK